MSRGAGQESEQADKPLPYDPDRFRTPAPSLIALARFRVPDSAPPAVAQLADRALQRASEIMEGRVDKDLAGHALRAAQMIRDEVCGPVPKTVNLTGQISIQDAARAAAARIAAEADGQ